MKTKIFIDGSEGTTGLRIFERFEGRDDIELLKIPSELRKDPEEVKKYINASDITFLCLPDGAAREAVTLIENDHVRIIDTSTAHRTEEGCFTVDMSLRDFPLQNLNYLACRKQECYHEDL